MLVVRAWLDASRCYKIGPGMHCLKASANIQREPQAPRLNGGTGISDEFDFASCATHAHGKDVLFHCNVLGKDFSCVSACSHTSCAMLQCRDPDTTAHQESADCTRAEVSIEVQKAVRAKLGSDQHPLPHASLKVTQWTARRRSVRSYVDTKHGLTGKEARSITCIAW